MATGKRELYIKNVYNHWYMDEDDYEIVDEKTPVLNVDYEEVPWDSPPQSPIETEKLKELSIAINNALNPPTIPTEQKIEPKIETVLPIKKKKVHTTF